MGKGLSFDESTMLVQKVATQLVVPFIRELRVITSD